MEGSFGALNLARRTAGAAFAAAVVLLSACGSGQSGHQRDFVGKWKSSRLATPIYLHPNGEWEIVDDDGKVKEYGIWQYRDGAILWSSKERSQVVHDRNPVLSVTPQEFRLREQNGAQTTFTRLDGAG